MENLVDGVDLVWVTNCSFLYEELLTLRDEYQTITVTYDFKHNTGHALKVFLIQMKEVGTVRVGGPLHVEVHLRD